MNQIDFIPASHFTQGRSGRKIKWLVIHTAEVPKTAGAAISIASFFAKEDTKASAHYSVDSKRVVQSVKEGNKAWHVRSNSIDEANALSVGIEHAGYAKQTLAEWGDAYNEAMLSLSSDLAAGICDRWDIQPVFLTSDTLSPDISGITTHHEITQHYGVSGGHYDPGPNFPIEKYLGLVRQKIRGRTVASGGGMLGSVVLTLLSSLLLGRFLRR